MLKNALTVLGSVLFVLVFCEIGLRIAGVSYPVFDDYDPLRGVRLRPGKEGWYQKEGAAYLRINSMGYRDREHPQEKPPGTFRIAVLGDSFSEARQVPQEDTFWSRLELQLGQCEALRNKRVEVMNFGVGGYNTSQELLTLKHDVLKFSPDLVLLAFFAGNDVMENSKALLSKHGTGWRIRGPHHVYADGVLVIDSTFQVPLWRQVLYEGIHRFRLLEIVNEARRVWSVRRLQKKAQEQRLEDEDEDEDEHVELGTSKGIYAPPVERAWRDAWRITEQLLLRIRSIVASHGAQFVIVTIPTSIQVHPDSGRRKALERQIDLSDLFYPDRRIAALGEQHGFSVIVLGERMQKIAEDRDIYFHGFENTALGKGHLNSAGHRVAGNILTEGICTPNVLNGFIEKS